MEGIGVSETSSSIFRRVALDRAASPEQLDYLVQITRPRDWIVGCIVLLILVMALGWGILGRVPVRAPGEGILISTGGRVADAVSTAPGRLGSVEVAVGQRVARGDVVAKIVQTEIEQRYRNAEEVLRERKREHAGLIAKIAAELAAKEDNFNKLEAGLNQVIKATDQRIEYLAMEVKNLEGLFAKGYTIRRTVEDRRRDLTDAQQRKQDTQNEILKLRTQKTDLQTQRDREIQDSEFRVNEARRQMEEVGGALGQSTQVLSPIDGRVVEIKVSPGAVLTSGTPILGVEAEGRALEALIYIRGDRGKSVKPGMEVRLEPSTVKREEFGTILGTVETISDFPITPQGMAAVLHNDTLVTRFTRDGAPYGAVVRLEPDENNPSGYRWAVGKGPPLRLSSGTFAKAEITTERKRPIDLVIPILRRLTGTAS
jgi:HlyD family secretion protein